MVQAIDEGTDFAGQFGQMFGTREATAKRLKAERQASKSPKQRARKAVRVEQINFRASAGTKALSKAIADKLGCSVADVMERALTELAKSQGVKQ